MLAVSSCRIHERRNNSKTHVGRWGLRGAAGAACQGAFLRSYLNRTPQGNPDSRVPPFAGGAGRPPPPPAIALQPAFICPVCPGEPNTGIAPGCGRRRRALWGAFRSGLGPRWRGAPAPPFAQGRGPCSPTWRLQNSRAGSCRAIARTPLGARGLRPSSTPRQHNEQIPRAGVGTCQCSHRFKFSRT